MDGPDSYRTVKAAAFFAAIKAGNLKSVMPMAPYFDLSALQNAHSRDARWIGRRTLFMWAFNTSCPAPNSCSTGLNRQRLA